MGGQDLLNHGADSGQRQLRLSTATPCVLQKTVRDGRQDDVALPAWLAPAFDVVERGFVLQFLIRLFDRLALVRELHEGTHRRRGGQVHQVVAVPIPAAQFSFAEQPDVGCQPSGLAPVVGRRHAHGTEAGAPCGIRPVAPRHQPSRAGRLRRGPGARLDGVRALRQPPTDAWASLAGQRGGSGKSWDSRA